MPPIPFVTISLKSSLCVGEQFLKDGILLKLVEDVPKEIKALKQLPVTLLVYSFTFSSSLCETWNIEKIAEYEQKAHVARMCNWQNIPGNHGFRHIVDRPSIGASIDNTGKKLTISCISGLSIVYRRLMNK
jgi:hypothetical protein